MSATDIYLRYAKMVGMSTKGFSGDMKNKYEAEFKIFKLAATSRKNRNKKKRKK